LPKGKPTVGKFLQTVVRDGRPGRVAAQVFAANAIIGTHVHICMNIEVEDSAQSRCLRFMVEVDFA
jgi:hypothetical protein